MRCAGRRVLWQSYCQAPERRPSHLEHSESAVVAAEVRVHLGLLVTNADGVELVMLIHSIEEVQVRRAALHVAGLVV
eukprot:scaffold11237_cov102-Phaeocystis_antarctica.AAC.1